LIPSPIHKVLSLISQLRLRCLLMGGQACVLYGAAEFTRDIDIHLLLDEDTSTKLNKLLDELQGEVIAVPEFAETHLIKGHAVHFRLKHPSVDGIRLDIMSKMRGVDNFESLWARRSEVELSDGVIISLLSLPDLVKAKKTQRDKDWPMVRRLIEADYFSAGNNTPSDDKVIFWLQELRSEELLIELCKRFPELANQYANQRPSILSAINEDVQKLTLDFKEEEMLERLKDREYWLPLKKELEQMRQNKKG